MTQIESKVKVMRLIQSGLIASIPIFALVAEVGRGHGSGRWTSLHWLMSGLAVWCIAIGFRYRRRWVSDSQQVLANDASNSKA
jgi:hypothetical protein